MKGRLWEKAVLVLQTAYHEERMKHFSEIKSFLTFQILHATILLQSYLPSTFCDLVFNNELKKCVDEYETSTGMLPIHIVSSQTSNQQSMKTAVTLMDEFPEGTRLQSSEGRLPFHYAILAGWGWDSLQILLKGYKLAFQTTDPVTGLSPFMLAASILVMSKFSSNDHNHTEEDDDYKDTLPPSISIDEFTTGYQNSPTIEKKTSTDEKEKNDEEMMIDPERNYGSTINSNISSDKCTVRSKGSVGRSKQLDIIYELLIANPNF